MNQLGELFILALKETSKSPHTIKSYKSALNNFDKWLTNFGASLKNFGRIDVQQYVDTLSSEKKAASTIHTKFQAIKAFAEWSGNSDSIQDIRLTKAPSLMSEAPQALDRNERNKIMREIDRLGNKRNAAIFFTFLYTGIRISELVALDISDIEISDRKGSLKVRKGKGNKERTIPLSPEARRAITLYLEERKDNNPALFLSTHKKRLSVRSVQHLCNKHGINPHLFRHTFVTNLVDQGIDDETIRTLTGHESPLMVARYRSVREEAKEDAVNKLYID